jgi:hypothetical protein
MTNGANLLVLPHNPSKYKPLGALRIPYQHFKAGKVRYWLFHSVIQKCITSAQVAAKQIKVILGLPPHTNYLNLGLYPL